MPDISGTGNRFGATGKGCTLLEDPELLLFGGVWVEARPAACCSVRLGHGEEGLLRRASQGRGQSPRSPSKRGTRSPAGLPFSLRCANRLGFHLSKLQGRLKGMGHIREGSELLKRNQKLMGHCVFLFKSCFGKRIETMSRSSQEERTCARSPQGTMLKGSFGHTELGGDHTTSSIVPLPFCLCKKQLFNTEELPSCMQKTPLKIDDGESHMRAVLKPSPNREK